MDSGPSQAARIERLKGRSVSDASRLNCSKALRAYHSLQLIKPELTWTHENWVKDLPQEDESDFDLDAELDAMFAEEEEDDEKQAEIDDP